MIYVDNINEFKEKIKEQRFKNKKLLFVFGDSWTNNTYLFNNGTYPKKSWAYQLAEKFGYDIVVNLSTDGGSNNDIFEWCLKTMCLFDEYEFEKCRINELETAEIKVIIGWSSQIRNFDSTTKIFRPWNVTSIPYTLGMNKESQYYKLYNDYIVNLHPEYYCYSTQLQTICLQHYFKHHKIDSYYFMAFTPLIENEIIDTKWDLRNQIDKNNFYKLDKIESMADTISSITQSDIKNEYVFDQPFLVENINSFYKTILNKKDNFVNFLENKFINSKKDNTYFMSDGHPNELGLEVMANELFELIKNDQQTKSGKES